MNDYNGYQVTDPDVGPEYTGRFIVLLDPENAGAGLEALHDQAGVAALGSMDSDEVAAGLAEGADVMLDNIGVAVVSADPEQESALLSAATEAPQVLAVEREQVMYAMPEVGGDFLRGYQAGVGALVQQLLGEEASAAGGSSTTATWDESRFTWGLQAITAPENCKTGAGVKVAVLDTGFDLKHRDFRGRSVVTASFVRGEDVQDGHGHGTHCIGTSCGPATPSALPRYGVAGEALIHAGKVLSNAGSGGDAGILAGIDWAVAKGCRVISMSLGAPVSLGSPYSQVYEGVARRALNAGTIIVAAAGNDSRRPGMVRPVGRPANCPSILAVGALTPDLGIAPFSNAGLNSDGGQVDVAAPGVDVLSSWPEPTGYRRLAGTSMATPHVAGILALLTQAYPKASAAELIRHLLTGAKRLPLPSTDVGSGLAQAGS